MITDFFGGMIIWLLSYFYVIIGAVILYLVTLLITLGKVLKGGIKANRGIFYTHLSGLVLILLFNLYQSELFKARKLLDATLFDDLSAINIVLRDGNQFETTSFGLFGYEEKEAVGQYELHGDTIYFLTQPYSNDFLPNTMIISKQDSALYFNKDSAGDFSQDKSYLNYFRINSINL